VERERTADVLRTLDARVRELRDRGPSPTEMAGATERLAHSLAQSFESVGGIVGAVGKDPVLGLAPDEMQTREARVRALTPAEVRAAVPPPEAMKAVVVGDLVSLRAQLVALGWGEIEERDTAGALVRTFTR
jgi:predicted Zn-dependent peptidase